MTSKKRFLYKLTALLTAAGLCLTSLPADARAAEQGCEYEVTGRMTADGPLFDGKESLEVKNGYYSMNLKLKWNYFTCESADGLLKIEYYIEKDDIYRFIITNQGNPGAAGKISLLTEPRIRALYNGSVVKTKKHKFYNELIAVCISHSHYPFS